MFKHLGQLELFLLEDFMIYIKLISKVAFYILSVAVHGTEVHVEQCGAAVNLEIACRYAILRHFCCGFCVVVACGREVDECLVKSNGGIDFLQQFLYLRIQPLISVLQLKGGASVVCRLEIARIIAHGYIVGDFVKTSVAAVEAIVDRLADLFVDEG